MATKNNKTEVIEENEELEVKNTKAILEDDLEVDVSLNANDVRFIFDLNKLQKLQKKSEAGRAKDEDGIKMAGLVQNLLELIIGEDALEDVIDYYVERDGEFALTSMTGVFEKIFAAVSAIEEKK